MQDRLLDEEDASGSGLGAATTAAAAPPSSGAPDDAEEDDALERLLDAYTAQAEAEARHAAEKHAKAARRGLHAPAAAKRREALSLPLPRDNKGYELLSKMGFQPGQGLGRAQQGRAEPVPLVLKSGRGGVGAEEARRRREREAAQRAAARGEWGVRLARRSERSIVLSCAACESRTYFTFNLDNLPLIMHPPSLPPHHQQQHPTPSRQAPAPGRRNAAGLPRGPSHRLRTEEAAAPAGGRRGSLQVVGRALGRYRQPAAAGAGGG